MTNSHVRPMEEAPSPDVSAFGLYPVVIRFKDRPSDMVFTLLCGRGFRYGDHAWYGEGVPAELQSLVRECGGNVEVKACIGGQLVTRHNPMRRDTVQDA